MKRLDKAEWKISSFSSSQSGDGNIVNILKNDDSYWHSQYSPAVAPPHWIVVDMAAPRNIRRLNISRRIGNGDTKTVQLFVSNNPNPDGVWTKIGEGVWSTGPADTSGNILSFDVPNETGRYLKIYMPDSNRSNVCTLREVVVYE